MAAAAEEQVKELEAKVEEQKQLIVKLEEDILKVLLHWFLFLGLLHEMSFSLVFFLIFLFADMVSDLKSL
jgi:hypothetical protein